MIGYAPEHVTVSSGGEGPLQAGPGQSLLRFLTCGSVDDGKSTLIGRLLYDTKLILEDQLVALERDSRKHGTTGDDIVQEMQAATTSERQGRLIDVDEAASMEKKKREGYF